MRRNSALLFFQEMQVETMRYYFISTGIAKIKRLIVPSVAKDVEQLEFLVGV